MRPSRNYRRGQSEIRVFIAQLRRVKRIGHIQNLYHPGDFEQVVDSPGFGDDPQVTSGRFQPVVLGEDHAYAGRIHELNRSHIEDNPTAQFPDGRFHIGGSGQVYLAYYHYLGLTCIDLACLYLDLWGCDGSERTCDPDQRP
jgi:hypothetical protein